SIRSAAARSTAVALVAQVHAVRVLSAVVASTAPTLRTRIAAALDRQDAATPDLPTAPSTPGRWALREVLRRDDEVRDGLAALRSGTSPRLGWRTPLYRSQRTAAAAGIRAALCVALASIFFVLAGWSSASCHRVRDERREEDVADHQLGKGMHHAACSTVGSM